MPELGFSEFREYVEDNTYLPEFHEVTRRARKRKLRRRIATTVKILGVLAVATPGLIVSGVVVANAYQAPNSTVLGFSGTSQQTDLSPPTAPITRTVVAADGIDLAHSYGLVDVCAGTSCNLELSQINPGPATSVTQKTGLFRQTPTQQLADPRLVVVNTSTVVVSAAIGAAGRTYQTITVSGGTEKVSSAPRPIQTTLEGAIEVVRGATGRPSALPHQPPVSVPELQSETDGWWVCGTSPDTGELSVSVSHDDGNSWTTHALGLLPDVTDGSGATDALAGAVLATSDGNAVYVLVLSGGQMMLVRSLNGGRSWSPTATAQAWPTGSRYGLVTRADGSLLVWFTREQVTTYLRSVDKGNTFTPVTGPPGPGGAIVKVEDGYLTLGADPAISHDGEVWAVADVPYVAVIG